jgi:hypothetical protein
MKQCCENCNFFVRINSQLGRCSWIGNRPSWRMDKSVSVLVDDGEDCPLFTEKNDE